MSAAGTSKAAGTGHERHPDDAYVTETRVVDALLRGVEESMAPSSLTAADYLGDRHGRPVLEIHPWANYGIVDAGAGTGAIIGTIRERGLLRSVGVEFRDDLAVRCLEKAPCLQASFFDVVQASMDADSIQKAGIDGDPLGLAGNALERPNLVIMNPPYLKAREFVEAALRWVRTTTVKKTSEKKYATVAALLRLPWLASKGRVDFHQKNPSAIWVLPDRPSFTGDNKVDATDYAWFVWTKNPAIQPGTWKILDMAGKPKLPRKVTPKVLETSDPEVEMRQLQGQASDLAEAMDVDRLRLEEIDSLISKLEDERERS